jgi:peroxiredoxin
VLFAIAACSSEASPPEAPRKRDDAAALIGTTPPAWKLEYWTNSPPIALVGLRDSVVLVRWWTAECPYCSESAPALRAFDREYGPRGLKVIGIYHHKGAGAFEPSVYRETARTYGFTFPLAVDLDWRTLDSWMRDAKGNKVDTGFTSVTFLLDREGVVRHVHPGGQYVEGDAAHAELRAAIERLL